MIDMTRSQRGLFLLSLLPFLLACGALEGNVLAFRTFNGDFISESYPLPPTSSGLAKHQSLDDDLAGFSLTCTSCVGKRRLVFEEESTQVHVVLSDRALSVIEIDSADEIQTTVAQAIRLDSGCAPLYLMPFTYSSDEFAIVCAGLNLQFASIDSNHQLTVGKLQAGTGGNGVFLESESQVKSVSYLGYGLYELYTVNTAEQETVSLPENVNCLDNGSVHPLHGQEAFLLSCTTPDGPTLYIVSLDREASARSIQASGSPHSSPDGSFIAIVSGDQVTTYVTTDPSIQGRPQKFAGQVTRLEFLSSHYVLILTANDEHIVMDINDTSNLPRNYPGGPPASRVWVSPSNHYIYVTQDNTLYVFDSASEGPVYDPKPITNVPEMLLFVEKYASRRVDPSDDTSPDSPPILPVDDSPQGNSNLGPILGGIAGVVLVIAAVVGIGFGLIVKYRRRQQPPPDPICMSIQEETDPTKSKLIVDTMNHDDQPTPDPPSPPASRAEGPSTPPPTRQPALDETEHSSDRKKSVPERRAEQIPLLELHTQPTTATAEKPSDGVKGVDTKNPLPPRSPPRSPIAALQDLALPVFRRRPGSGYMAFKENPSASRNTMTDTSVFTQPEEEEGPLHEDLVQ